MIEAMDDDALICCRCGRCERDDKIVYHGEDYYLCPPCSAKFIAKIESCHHDWGRDDVMDEYGEVGHCCGRCGWFVEKDWAMITLPFICDGYVEVPAG